MKTLKLFSIVLMMSFLNAGHAQTADEIIEKHVKAIGGREKLNAIKTVKMTGKLSVQGMEIQMTMYFRQPNSMRTESVVQGMTMVNAFDDKTKTGWYTNPMSGDKTPQKMNQEQTTSMEETSEMIVGPLTNYKEKGGTVDLIGKEDLEGTEVYKLMLTKRNKNVVYYFLDVSTYLILKETTKTKFEDKEIETESYYSNYKNINGVMLAGTQEEKEGGQLQSQINLDKIELDVPLLDELFVMPAVEAKDPKAGEKK
jgi:hypothetical protein